VFVYNFIDLQLRGRVKFPTGGDKAKAFQSVTRVECFRFGGSGETPEPTVKVWMGEVRKRYNWASMLSLFVIPYV